MLGSWYEVFSLSCVGVTQTNDCATLSTLISNWTTFALMQMASSTHALSSNLPEKTSFRLRMRESASSSSW